MKNVRKSFQIEHDSGFFLVTQFRGCIEIKDIIVEGDWGDDENHTLADKLIVDVEQVGALINALRSLSKKQKKAKKNKKGSK